MNNATWAMLNDAEKALLRETERDALVGLDEDTLIDLHARVRRARTKYTKLYRRRAGEAVGKDRSRAAVHAKNARTAAKAEAFEDALARVSRSLARAARLSADDLRTERLAQARKASKAKKGASEKPSKKASSKSKASVKKRSARAKSPAQTPASKRARAAARATQKRSQAKRDRR